MRIVLIFYLIGAICAMAASIWHCNNYVKMAKRDRKQIENAELTSFIMVMSLLSWYGLYGVYTYYKSEK